ncbi:tyrosyl-DNA phosphodiesterase 2-like [Octopus sinensis]|uniref:Tyrosyl-DNA phosphodiesterase 2-like n=1 Tax=Octopus sinensis TaxID=2607531 RepID=A0A6P7U8Y8_9MOLL|nr:tyrosyl-DNA phosphodiesterase 2-like [Octopus sinensis]
MSAGGSKFDIACANFAEITDTDTALAMFYLQDVDWDLEVAAIGGVPDGLVDVWEATGGRKETMHTWDTTRNHNLRCSYACRKRMDRMYLKSDLLTPIHFELVGLEIVPNTQLFPSDHWGIVAHFVL